MARGQFTRIIFIQFYSTRLLMLHEWHESHILTGTITQ